MKSLRNVKTNDQLDSMKLNVVKVHTFWDGHKILRILLIGHRTKVRWRFRKILWPSQNIWTLFIILSDAIFYQKFYCLLRKSELYMEYMKISWDNCFKKTKFEFRKDLVKACEVLLWHTGWIVILQIIFASKCVSHFISNNPITSRSFFYRLIIMRSS